MTLHLALRLSVCMLFKTQASRCIRCNDGSLRVSQGTVATVLTGSRVFSVALQVTPLLSPLATDSMWTGVSREPMSFSTRPGHDARAAAESAASAVAAYLHRVDVRTADKQKAVHAHAAAAAEVVSNELYTCHLCARLPQVMLKSIVVVLLSHVVVCICYLRAPQASRMKPCPCVGRWNQLAS